MKQLFFTLLTMLICLTAIADRPDLNVIAMVNTEASQNANETSIQTRQVIAPWIVTCVHSSMPNPSNSANHLETKICKAEQTINKKLLNKMISATANISSIMTSFTITNIKIRENSALLLMSKNKPIPLNVFCNSNKRTPTCSLMLRDKKITNNEIMAALSHGNNFKIQFKSVNHHQLLEIEFSLTNFNKISQIILSADNQIKNIFQPIT